MKVRILNVPVEDATKAMELGVQYCEVRRTWYLLDSFATYPQSKNKLYKKWDTRKREVWDEAEYRRLVMKELEAHFTIKEEVSGKHFSGTRLRIDAVITPKETDGWKNPQVALGLEFKEPTNIKGKHYFTYWAKQALDYAHTNWTGFGYLPILLGPNADELFKSDLGDLLGAYKIGRVSITNGVQFFISTKKVWCQTYGVQDYGKVSPLIPKFGAR